MTNAEPTNPPPLPPANSFQFRLQHLFGLTTIAAVAAALAARDGSGTLLTSAGFLVAWLNLCGAFRGVQAGLRRDVILWLAWSLFLLSLALPSLTVFGPVLGYGAAWIALAMPFEHALKGDVLRPALIWYLAINIANGLALLLPLLIWRLRRGQGRWLSATLAISMVAPWFACWDTPLLAGYYVWCASFLLALTSIRIGPRTLVAMLGMAALVFALQEYIH
jgi:hypothetical protein